MNLIINTRLAATGFGIVSLALCFASQTEAQAAIVNEEANSKAASAAKASDAAERLMTLRRNGFEALYNLDYAEAQRAFKSIEREFPQHPAGFQFQAATLLLETLNRSRRLQTSIYNDEGFYAEENDKPDANLVGDFRRLTTKAETLATAGSLNAREVLKRVEGKKDFTLEAARGEVKDEEIEMLYFLGSARAIRAAFAVSVERSFRKAISDGRAAVEVHKDVMKLSPTYHDAELSIGIQDYVIGDLPLPVKLTLSVGGVRGSKKRGLKTLERVASDGKFASDDARALLIGLYRRENRPVDALAQARALAGRYPRNYLFKLEIADALIAVASGKKGVRVENRDAKNETGASSQSEAISASDLTNAQSEAFAVFESLLTQAGRDKSVPLDLVRFKYAEALLQAGDGVRAAAEFMRAANEKEAERALITNAHLRAAQSFDLAGERDKALTEYRKVLTLPNAYGAHAKANRGLKQAFKKEDLVKQMKRAE